MFTPQNVELEPELDEVPAEVFHDLKEEEEPKKDLQEEDVSRTEEMKRYVVAN